MDECIWREEDNGDYICWETSCEKTFCMTEGTPKDNSYNYCPNCGGALVEKD